MRQNAALLEPVINVREVLESYLRDRVLLREWQQVLRAASNRFRELGSGWSDVQITALGEQVLELADAGLEAEPGRTESVAAEIARLLDETDVPGVPRPEDADWGF